MVRVLFDQGTPVGLRKHLGTHRIDTLAERGWGDKQNGEMLDLAEGGRYEILVTTDRNMQYQQHLAKRRIGIVVLVAARWPQVALHAPKIDKAITTVGHGNVIEVYCGANDDRGKQQRQHVRKRRKRSDRHGRSR